MDSKKKIREKLKMIKCKECKKYIMSNFDVCINCKKKK